MGKGTVPTYCPALFQTVLIYTAALGVSRLNENQIVKHYFFLFFFFSLLSTFLLVHLNGDTFMYTCINFKKKKYLQYSQENILGSFPF